MAVITRYGEEKTRVARQPAVRWTAAARLSGLVASAAKRQVVGACAAPALLPPRAPRQVPGFVTARRRRGGTTPSAYAVKAARSMDGEGRWRNRGAVCWMKSKGMESLGTGLDGGDGDLAQAARSIHREDRPYVTGPGRSRSDGPAGEKARPHLMERPGR